MEEQRHNDELILNELKWIKDTLTDFKNINSAQHEDILEHQKITNGRVNKLEQEMSFSKGMGKVMMILVVPIFLGVAGYIVNYFLNR